MFILVSLPLVLVTGGLSGPPWGTFWFLQVGWEFWCVQFTPISPEQIQKIKKVCSLVHPFFYNEWTSVGRLGNYWASVGDIHVNSNWLGWFCVLYRYNTCFYCTNTSDFYFRPSVLKKIWIFFNRWSKDARYLGAPLSSHKKITRLRYI